MSDKNKRAEILLKDFGRLNEENQYILLSECHDLLKAQELREKHLKKGTSEPLFFNRSSK